MAKRKSKNEESGSGDDFFNSATIKKIHKDYGVSCIVPVKSELNRDIPIIKTLPSLDIALGGGIMTGQIVQLSGIPKIGKTTLAFNIADCFLNQFKDKRVYYYKVEGRFNSFLVKMIDGFDVERFHLIKSTRDRILSGVDYLDILEKIVRADPDCLHIVDSVGGVVGELEMTNTMKDQQMGELAKLMTKFCKRNTEAADVMGSTIIMLNHVREKMQGRGGTYSPGGKHFMHSISTDIQLKKQYPNGDITDSEGEVIGANVEALIKTTPLGPPFKKTVLSNYFGESFKKIYDVINIAEELEIITNSGAWYYYKEHKMQGRANMIKAIKESEEIYLELEKDVEEMLGINNASNG